MDFTVAVIGAGRMGRVVGGQLPKSLNRLVIDTDEDKARACAGELGARHATQLSAAADADLVALVVPAPAINPILEQLIGIVKKGAIVINMATSAKVDPTLLQQARDIHIVDCKILGSARAMAYGAPCYVVVGTKDNGVLDKISYALSGYAKVLPGDPDIVPVVNSLASEEGIRCGVRLRKRLAQFSLPKDWEQVLLYTVAAGTLQSFAMDDLGHFAQELADKIAGEDD